MALAMPAVMCAPAVAGRGAEGRAPRARAQPLAAQSSRFLAGASIGGAPRRLAVRATVAAQRGARRGAVAAAADGSAGKPSGYTVLVAEKLGKAGIDMLKAYGTVVEAFDMSQADLCAKVSLCDALIVRSATKVRPPAWRRRFAARALTPRRASPCR